MDACAPAGLLKFGYLESSGLDGGEEDVLDDEDESDEEAEALYDDDTVGAWLQGGCGLEGGREGGSRLPCGAAVELRAEPEQG